LRWEEGRRRRKDGRDGEDRKGEERGQGRAGKRRGEEGKRREGNERGEGMGHTFGGQVYAPAL